MSENSGFTPDGKWWWSGASWVPATAPDGKSAIWNGSVWVLRGGSTATVTLAFIAIGLWVFEFIWAAVVVFVLILQANSEYEARGRVGTEDIANTAVSVPLLATLLILPAIITVLTAANVRRWWLGIILGGWPLIALVALTTGLGAIVAVGVALAAVIGIAWLVHRQVWGKTWQLSADGQTWARGGRSFSTLSADGHWRWNGQTWLPTEPAGGVQAVVQPKRADA